MTDTPIPDDEAAPDPGDPGDRDADVSAEGAVEVEPLGDVVDADGGDDDSTAASRRGWRDCPG